MNKRIISYILIGTLAVSIGTYARLYPLLNFTTGDSSEKAAVFVIAYLRSKITTQVNQAYPQLPAVQKELLIKKQLDTILHQEGKNVRGTIDQVSKNFQDARPSSRKTPYLLESDPFYYYNLTENILLTGKISETVKGSKYLNTLMLAPEGHWEPLTLHPYVGFFLYRVMKIFNPDTSLMYAVSFTPLVVSALAVVPFLFLSYSLGCHVLISFVGSIFFLLAPIFIKRSTFGWYDNDPYNIFFPLTILAILFYALDNINRDRHYFRMTKIMSVPIYISLCILLYAYFWQGWVFLFSILFLSGFALLLYNHWLIKNISVSKKLIAFYLTLLLGSFGLLSIAFGAKDFFVLFQEGWTALTNFLTPQLSPWPDLYITVGELHKLPPKQLIEILGGFLFFGISVLGFMVAVHDLIFHPKSNSYKLIVLVLFFAVAAVLTLGAQRFAMLLLTPAGLLFCLGLQHIYQFLKNQGLKIYPKKYPAAVFHGILLGLLLLLAILPIVNIRASIPFLLNPIFNETWEKALIAIREKTPPQSIINAWWPPGHFIKAIAHRRVTFDGATINFPQAYWLANVYLASDETQALGMLRMINSSANAAAEYLESLGIKLSAVVKILTDITALDKDQAGSYLEGKIQPAQIDHLLQLTHATPPPSYLFLYNEFVDNNIQLSYIAKWNFKKIEEINSRPDLLKKVPNHNSKEYVQFLWDMVGGPYAYTTKITELSRMQNTVVFEENFFLNLDTMEAYLQTKTNEKNVPQSIFYLEDGKVIEKKLLRGNLPYSVVVFQENNRYYAIMLDRRLAQSLLVTLYFFDGAGLKYFHPLIHEADLTGRTDIKVFAVDWEKFEKDLETD